MDPFVPSAHLSLYNQSKILLHKFVGNDKSYGTVVKQLVNPNEKEGMGYSLLQVAAWSRERNPKIVQLLIDDGARVDECTAYKHTPLHFAVAHRQRPTVLLLIAAGASVNSRDFLGRSVLHFAMGAKWWYPHIPKLDFPCDVWILENLLTHPDISLNSVDNAGNTPLMWAVKRNNWKAVHRLLKKGANPNIPNMKNRTPLHYAFSTRNPDYRLAFALLTNGAGIYCEDAFQQTPVDILVDSVKTHGTLVFAKHVVWLIALRYRVRDSLKLKLEEIPELSEYFESCYREVRGMRKLIIYDKFTFHDFILDCFHSRFVDPDANIDAAVIGELASGSYLMYLFYIETISTLFGQAL